jgi:hypothetical protein
MNMIAALKHEEIVPSFLDHLAKDVMPALLERLSSGEHG